MHWGGAHRAWAIAALVALAGSAAPRVIAQGDERAPVAIEEYLQQRGLKSLLAEHLAQRIKQTTGPEREKVAERLAKLYIELIASSESAEQRESWYGRARELVAFVPEAGALELRIDLAKEVYVRAEEICEQHRLRVCDETKRAEAERLLRQVRTQFEQLAGDLARKVESMEKSSDPDKFADVIDDARRARARAYYYAGWSGYYLAQVTGSDAQTGEALRAFGQIMGMRGVSPRIDKFNAKSLQHDAVARATIGTALTYSVRGDDNQALAWLDLIEKTPESAASVRDQLLPRRIAILAQAKRWADLYHTVAKVRSAQAGGTVPLPIGSARLLAVLTLEAGRNAASDESLTKLSQMALEDLVAHRQLAHVLDLTKKYGTILLGDSGFIVLYVRGAQAYDQAVELRKRSNENRDEPSTNPEIINAFVQVAQLLDSSVAQSDAEQFKAEAARAGLLAGRALYFAGELKNAADRFAQASERARQARNEGDAQEAHWLAIVALDRLVRVQGEASTAPAVLDKLDELVALFTRFYPGTERAAQLAVRLSAAGKVSDEDAIKVLLAVPKEGALYESSRRQAARLLYKRFRGATGDDRAFAANRFLNLAQEMLVIDRRAALTLTGKPAQEAGERVVSGARQMLDALLGGPTPDVARAQGVFDILTQVSEQGKIDLKAFADELDFRRFQVLLARDDEAGAEAMSQSLSARASRPGGEATRRFAISAARVMYQRATQRWQRAQNTKASDADMLAALQRVVRYGGVVVEQLKLDRAQLTDPAVASAYANIARAAFELFKRDGSIGSRDLAIKLDKEILAATPGNTDALTRLGELSESAGDVTLAIECWRQLSAGLAPGSDAWFRARYENIRLLINSDPRAAEIALRQHALLYPKFGPPPWGEKLEQMHKQIVPEAPLPSGEKQGGGA